MKETLRAGRDLFLRLAARKAHDHQRSQYDRSARLPTPASTAFVDREAVAGSGRGSDQEIRFTQCVLAGATNGSLLAWSGFRGLGNHDVARPAGPSPPEVFRNPRRETTNQVKPCEIGSGGRKRGHDIQPGRRINDIEPNGWLRPARPNSVLRGGRRDLVDRREVMPEGKARSIRKSGSRGDEQRQNGGAVAKAAIARAGEAEARTSSGGAIADRMIPRNRMLEQHEATASPSQTRTRRREIVAVGSEIRDEENRDEAQRRQGNLMQRQAFQATGKIRGIGVRLRPRQSGDHHSSRKASVWPIAA